jgi:hypothetical protein
VTAKSICSEECRTRLQAQDHDFSGPALEQVAFFRKRRVLQCLRSGYFEVSFDTGRDAVNVRVQFGDPCSLFFIIERVRAIFDLDAGWATIARTLGTDSVLASYQVRSRIASSWLPECFEFATRAISEQKIDIRRANALTGRIVRDFGQPFGPVGGITHLFPTPEVLANADLESIRLPRLKADANRALAVAFGQIGFERVADSGALLARLYEIPGIRRCAAQWVRETGRDLVLYFCSTSPLLKRRSLSWKSYPWGRPGSWSST